MTLRLANGTPASSFAFGTMQWGGRADEAESQAMWDYCRSHGISHFDTANGYTEGRSETLLGRFAATNRDAVYIATKVAIRAPATRDTILSEFDQSRARLGMDMVDLLYLHRWDPVTPIEESIGTLAELQQKGLIRHIGLSNCAAWQAMKAQVVAERMGTRIDAIQPMYNLVKRQAEVEILPMAADQGMTTVPYSPLGGGLLTGKYRRGGTGRLTEDRLYAVRYAPRWMAKVADALAELAAEVSLHPATLATAWVAAHPTRPHPIISARSVAQLRPSVAAMDAPVWPELIERISTLSPAPPPATDRLEEQ